MADTKPPPIPPRPNPNNKPNNHNPRKSSNFFSVSVPVKNIPDAVRKIVNTKYLRPQRNTSKNMMLSNNQLQKMRNSSWQRVNSGPKPIISMEELKISEMFKKRVLNLQKAPELPKRPEFMQSPNPYVTLNSIKRTKNNRSFNTRKNNKHNNKNAHIYAQINNKNNKEKHHYILSLNVVTKGVVTNDDEAEEEEVVSNNTEV